MSKPVVTSRRGRSWFFCHFLFVQRLKALAYRNRALRPARRFPPGYVSAQ